MIPAVITCYSENMAEVAALTVPTHAKFAETWSMHHEARTVPQEGAIWAKIAMIREYLDRGHPLVCWLDADAAVTNPTKREPRTSSLALTCDVHGPNAGIMFIANTLLTRQFFFALSGHARQIVEDRINPEQTGIRLLTAHLPYDRLLEIRAQRTMNSYWPGAYQYPGAEEAHWQKGDLILHLPGLENERRLEILSQAL
jgi:hypothetical protein